MRQAYTNRTFPQPLSAPSALWGRVRFFQHSPAKPTSEAETPLVLELCGHFGCKIGTIAIDSLAEGKAREPSDANRRPGRLCRLLDDA